MDTKKNKYTRPVSQSGDSKDEDLKDATKGEASKVQSVEELWQIKKIHESQREMVQQSMHQAMSPISAISGYLELIKMFLAKDDQSQQIEKYRSKIEEGMSELEKIVEDLYDMCDSANKENGEATEIKTTG